MSPYSDPFKFEVRFGSCFQVDDIISLVIASLLMVMIQVVCERLMFLTSLIHRFAFWRYSYIHYRVKTAKRSTSRYLIKLGQNYLTKIKTQTLLNTIKRCSKLALTCVVTDSVCMVLYILLMNYTPINLVNLLYLIDSNINLLRYVNFLGREIQTIISPLTTKKSNYDSKIVAKCTHALAREKSSEFVCAWQVSCSWLFSLMWLYIHSWVF